MIMNKTRFNRRSSAETVTENLDLTGLNIVLTGVSSGLGAETLRVLTKRGAHVIALARSLQSASSACDKVVGKTTALACDLSDLDSVASCAKDINELELPIDRIICNAGIMALPSLSLCHGVEKQFATNHLGHYLLIRLLLDKLLEAKNPRVVITSSMGHQQTPKGGIAFDNLDGSQGYNAWEFYGQSKLANVLTAKALSKRFAGQGLVANSVHPGVIRTNLSRHTQGWFSTLIYFFATFFERSIEQGAATQTYVATHPDLAGVTGQYYSDCRLSKPSSYARDDALADSLWDVSEKLVNSYL